MIRSGNVCKNSILVCDEITFTKPVTKFPLLKLPEDGAEESK